MKGFFRVVWQKIKHPKAKLMVVVSDYDHSVLYRTGDLFISVEGMQIILIKFPVIYL